MFKDRTDAGVKLAHALEKYKEQNVLILAIPRGGVEVGYEVAKYLHAEFSILVSRKLPYPENPEAGFGALTEDGSVFIFEEGRKLLTEEIINKIVAEQKQEMKRRINILRGGKSLPKIKDKIVILVDDGIAMGSTMLVSIMFCKNQKAKKIVVAVPVSGRKLMREITERADEIIILEKPLLFYAVAQAYRYWRDVSDEEALQILEKWKKENNY
jgi:putative phosphoribosyl transferase